MSHPDELVEFGSLSLLNSDLEARRKTLEDRLEDGFCRIDQAVLSGTDVSEWESFWLQLLGEYEGVCRELDQAA